MAISSIGNFGNAPVAVAQGGTNAPRATTPEKAAQKPEAAVSQQSPPSRETVEQAVTEIRNAVATMSARDLNFMIDGDTGRTVVRVVDSDTGDTIRQIPAQELIDIAKALDRAQGLLLRQKA